MMLLLVFALLFWPTLVIAQDVMQQAADAALSVDGRRTFAQVDATGWLKINCKVGCAGGTQYTEGDIDATITGTVAMMEVGANTLQPVQGTVADGLLVNLGANNDVTVTGSLTTVSTVTAVTSITNPVAVTGTFWQGTQPVSAVSLPLPTGAATAALQTQPGVDIGDVTINNASIAVTGTFWQATQPVSGTFWQATQPVSGTFWQATQPVSGTVTATQATATNLRIAGGDAAGVPTAGTVLAVQGIASGTAVPISGTLTAVTSITNPVAVTGTFWQATQPISAVSLPLPTGAATAALQLPDGHNVTVDNGAGVAAVNIQDGGNVITVDGTVTAAQATATNLRIAGGDAAGVPTAGTVLAVQGIASGTAIPVSGTFWQTTQPVSAVSLPLPAGAATAALQLPDGHNVTVDNAAGAAAVNIQDGGNAITVDGAVTVTGSVTANAGTNLNTSLLALEAGGNLATIAGDTTSIQTSVELMDDTIATLGTTTYLEATTKGQIVGALRRDADTTAVNTDNEVAPLLVNAIGALKVEVFSGETLPVSLTSTTVTGTVAVTQSGTWDEVGINDSGNAITVDWAGTAPPIGAGLEATALRVTVATDSTGVLSVDDNGGELTVNYGSGTFIVGDGAGALNVICDSGCAGGTQYAVDTALGATPTGTLAIAIRDDALSALTPVEGDAIGLRVDANGALWTIPSGTVTVSDGAGAMNTIIDSGTLTAVTSITNAVTVTDGAGALNVICDSGCAGGTQYAVDTALGATPTGTLAIAIRDDALSALTPVEGDAIGLRVDANGALWMIPSGTVTVSDGAGAMNTIVDSGTLTAVTSITNTVTVSDGAGAMNVICDSGCAGGTQYAVDTALGATPTGTLAIAIRDDALSALTPVEGDAIGLRVDANGALWMIPSGTTIVGDGAGALNVIVDSGTVTANAGTGTFVVGDGAGALNVIVDSGTTAVTQATATNLRAEVVGPTADNAANPTAKLSVLPCVANAAAPTRTETNVVPCRTNLAGDIAVTLDGEVPAVTVNSGTITTVSTVSAATITTFPDNEPFNVAQINGVIPLMGNGVTGTGSQRVTIASDNTAFAIKLSQTTTDNDVDVTTLPSVTIGTFPDNEPFNVALINGVVPLMGNGITGTGSQRVTIASDNTAFTVNIGTFPDNEPINVAQFGGTAVVTGTGAAGLGIPRVTVSNDSSVIVGTFPDNEPFNLNQIAGTAIVTGGIAGSQSVGGSVATDGPVSTQNPVYVGGRTEDSVDAAPGLRVSAEGDVVPWSLTRDGAGRVIIGGAQQWTYHENSSSALTDATVHASCGVGLFNYISSLVFSTGAATAASILIEDSTTTTILGPYYLEAVSGRGLAINFIPAKKQTTAATLISVTTTGAVAHSIDIQGWCAE